MGKLKRLWRKHRLLVTAFVLASAVTLFFALRTVLFFAYWNDPAHRNQPLEGWMTIGYVAHSWRVPADRLARALNLPPPPEDGTRPPLKRLAKERGESFESFSAEIEEKIRQLRAEGPPPEGAPP